MKYKVVKVPFPADMVEKLAEEYKSKRSSPGGYSIRFRMGRGMVASVDEPVSYDSLESTIDGMGMSKLRPFMLMLQPRQHAGLMRAKSAGKPYDLVLTKSALTAMHGAGWFSDIFKPIVKIVAPMIEAVAPGAQDAVEKWGEKAVDTIDDAISKKKAAKELKVFIMSRRADIDAQLRAIKSNKALTPAQKAVQSAQLMENFNEAIMDKAKEIKGSGVIGDALEVGLKSLVGLREAKRPPPKRSADGGPMDRRGDRLGQKKRVAGLTINL